MQRIFFDFIYSYGGAQQATALLLNRLSKSSPTLKVTPIVFDNFDPRFMKAIKPLQTKCLESRFSGALITRQKSPFTFFLAYVTGFFHFLKATRSALDAGNGEILLLTNSVKGLVYLVAARALIGRKIKVFFYVRGSGSENSIGDSSLFFTRVFVDKYLCVSNNTRENIIRRGVCPEKSFVTYTTIEWPDHLTEPSSFSSQTRCRLKLLYAASIIEGKGLDKLLKAIGKARINMPVHLVIAGDTPYESHRLFRERCIALSAELPPSVTTEWLGWVDGMQSVISSVDAVVLLSDDEGLPRIIQESMMFKKAVLSTAVGGAPELVEDGVTGVLCGSEEREIVTALERLANSDVDKMGRLGFEKLSTMLSPKSQLERVQRALWS